MCRRLVALIAVAPFLVSASAWAQISLVHATSCGPQTLPDMACSIPLTGSGNLIVVGVQLGGGIDTGTTISGVTDNAGNIYAEAGAALSIDTSAGSVVDVWYAKNSFSGANSITITPSASVSNAGAVIWEFSGVDPTAPLDQTAVLNSQGSTTTVAAPAISISSASEVLISLTAVSGNVTGVASGNAFASDAILNGEGWAHLVTSSTGIYSAAWNENPAGTYASSTVSFKAASAAATSVTVGPISACDLAPPYGTIDGSDVNAAVSMALGTTPCTADIDGAAVCNVAVVQRVVNASMPGGICVTGTTVPHSVSLNWVASTTPNVTYNIYRTATSSMYSSTPLASSGATTSYTDITVQFGQTYYYVVTASSAGSESVPSNEVPATIPSP